jgi:hypothetical protein
MFNRGSRERAEGPVSVEITLEDGHELQGTLVVPPGRSLTEVLNGTSTFIEFEPIRGERMFIAKSALQAVRPMNVPAAPSLGPKTADAGTLDPAAVLGVKADAGREEVREAYLNLAKAYHPDRYASAELPLEVHDYLSAMARRINAAYDAWQAAHKRRAAKQEPVFTKAGQG